jgi:hypothetical protein
MSAPHPHSPADLALAPVLISIERNLARVRDGADLNFTLALALNDDSSMYRTPAERADRVQRAATGDVDLRGWSARPTPDGYGLAVRHGEYEVTLMMGPRLTDYIRHGVPAAQPG